MPPSHPHFFSLPLSISFIFPTTATMRSFATVAAAAAVLSTASAFAPQARKSPLSTVVSTPETSNVVLRQASEEVDPLDISPEVRKRCRMHVSHVLSWNTASWMCFEQLFRRILFVAVSALPS